MCQEWPMFAASCKVFFLNLLTPPAVSLWSTLCFCLNQEKNNWGFSVKKNFFGIASFSFGSLVLWPFSFSKSRRHLLAACAARAVQMLENITHALKDGFFFLRLGEKDPFSSFWHREVSFYPILTLIP